MSDSLKYFISVFLYGTLGFFLAFINVNSEFVVFCRGFFGCLFILCLLAFKKQKIDIQGIKRNLKYLIICGLALGLNETFLFIGYKYAVSLASLGNYTAPISIIIISAILYKQKVSPKQVACIIASFVGIILLSGVLSGTNNDIRGLIFGLLGSIGFITLVFMNKKLDDIGPYDKTLVQLFVSACTCIPLVLINKSYLISFDIKTISILLMLGIIHTGFAYCLYFDSIKTLSPIKIAIIGYVEPVMSVLIGALFLKESMDVYTIVGAILILGSAIISELLNNKKELV